MLVAGTGDGVYHVTGIHDATDATDGTVRRVLDVPRAERVRRFDPVDGLFAATGTGLYHSPDGHEWTDLGVPVETVWAVAVPPAGDRLYAGTRPTHVYVTALPDDGVRPDALDWRECEAFRRLPGRDDWGVPRHDHKAQVRSLGVHPDAPDRVVAGVEPGGVHVSDDRGETWTPRDDGVHEDVHELHVVDGERYVAATGRGLYRTTDAGRSWTRLDGGVDQRYFRSAHVHDGVLYAAGACNPPSERWEDHESDPTLFAWRDGGLERVDRPRPDEMVVGWASVGEALVAATHRGTVLRRDGGDWRAVADIPSPETIAGCYCNLAWVDP
ncbi:WD40/YVTN/BNR-like repeat-containing protein [Halorarius halobius]|uniref:WD40/YVTN/BNR-like repeat-containing protein n=1 Tax=Halorarius halobius TaxID=2962671 RepID=UPI0020CC9532|nr:WD40 repeat domain-containing protein [Halorarius halobius]